MTPNGSAFDYTKPFVVELSYRDSRGVKYTVEKLTYPLKQSVEYRKRLELPSPWDNAPTPLKRIIKAIEVVSSNDLQDELRTYLKTWKETSERPSGIVPVKVVEAL